MLHLVLLGIRTSLKEDFRCTAAELVYGTSLSIPGEFFVPHDASDIDPASYVARLKCTMQVLHCKPTRNITQSRMQSRSQCNNRIMDLTKSSTGVQRFIHWPSKAVINVVCSNHFFGQTDLYNFFFSCSYKWMVIAMTLLHY